MKQHLAAQLKHIFLKIIGSCLVVLFVCSGRLSGQTTIATTANFTNQATVSTVTFNFQNTNSFPVVITNMEGVLSNYGVVSTEIWYKTSAISAAPGTISVGNGWTLSGSASINGILDTTDNITQPLFNTLSLTIPANTTYGIAVAAYTSTGGVQRTGDAASSVTVGAGGCNFLSGNNIGYAAAAATPAAPTLTPKGWIGKITFIPGGACTGTPITATASGPANICYGALFNLSASSYAIGGSIGYQWQKYNTTTAVWEDIPLATTPNYTLSITAATQFRFKTICTSTNTFSVSNTVTVNIGSGLAGGAYTINKNAPGSATNFVSFSNAAAAMVCGITGPVTFNVVPGSGPYTESVFFNNIPGTNAVDRIRINGNGNTIQSISPGNYLGVILVDGTKYMTIDSLTIRTLSLSETGITLADTASHDSIMHCFVDMRSINIASGNQSVGISLSGYFYNPIVHAEVGNCYVGYNHILATTAIGGPSYGIMDGYYGNNQSNQLDSGNAIVHNVVENCYTGGIATNSNNGTLIAYNDIHRTNKTGSTGNFFGINCWASNDYSSVVAPVNKVKIIGNRVHNPSINNTISNFTGIEVENDWDFLYLGHRNNFLIANNAIYNVNADVGSVTGIYLVTGNFNTAIPSLDTTMVYNNTIDIHQTSAAGATSGIVGITYNDNHFGVVSNDAERVFMENNLITISSASTVAAAKYGFMYINPTLNIPLNLNAQRNDVYITGTGTGYYCSWDGTNYLNAAAFQAFMPGQEMGTISADPQYIAAAAGDLTPSDLLLFGNGVNVQSLVPIDILGRPRPGSPTLGAFEVGWMPESMHY
jgi:hypothetical protein